jgi:hypothetical protein
MVELECPMCDGAVLVAFDAADLACRDCATTVEIDAVDVAYALAKAA